jgi:hypothetical protein
MTGYDLIAHPVIKKKVQEKRKLEIESTDESQDSSSDKI